MQETDALPVLEQEAEESAGTAFDGRSRRTKEITAGVLFVVLLALLAAFYLREHEQPSANLPRSSAASGAPAFSFEVSGAPGAAFDAPTGIAAGSDGRMYVADARSGRIRVFDAKGRYLFSFGQAKDGKPGLDLPARVAVSPSGEIYVTDRGRHALYVFASDGDFRRAVAPKQGPWSPLGVGFGANGRVYVTDVGDAKRHRVVVFDGSGKQIEEFGSTMEVADPRSHPGSFYYPNSVIVRGDSVYVADSNNGRIQVFDLDGRFRYLIVTGDIPRGLAFNARGQMLVVDTLGSQIDVYKTQTGERLYSFGSAGTGPGELQYPNDLATDTAGRVLIADRGNGDIQVWGDGTPSSLKAASVLRRVSRPAWVLLVAVGSPLIVLVAAGTLLYAARHRQVSPEDAANEDDE